MDAKRLVPFADVTTQRRNDLYHNKQSTDEFAPLPNRVSLARECARDAMAEWINE